MDKEGIEARLVHDYINYDREVMLAIKKTYPDLFKKYLGAFERARL